MPSADERISSELGNQFSAAHNSSNTFLFTYSHPLPASMNSCCCYFLVKNLDDPFLDTIGLEGVARDKGGKENKRSTVFTIMASRWELSSSWDSVDTRPIKGKEFSLSKFTEKDSLENIMDDDILVEIDLYNSEPVFLLTCLADGLLG